MPARFQILLAALLFSTGGAAIKSADFSAWQIAGLRSGVAALALLVLVPAARRGWSWRSAMVGVAYAATLTLFVLANKLTTAANTIFLQATAPLYLLLLGPLLLREPIRKRDLGVMAALVVGMGLFFAGTDAPAATAPDPERGNLLALASGVCWALLITGLRWLGAGKSGESAVAAVVIGNLMAFGAALPFALPIAPHPVSSWAVIGYLGVFQIALAYRLVTSAIRTVPALEASLLMLLEPALNPLWAWLVHGESPTAWALAGGTLIMAATVLRAWQEARTVPQSI